MTLISYESGGMNPPIHTNVAIILHQALLYASLKNQFPITKMGYAQTLTLLFVLSF